METLTEAAQSRAVDAASVQTLYEAGLIGWAEARTLLESVFPGEWRDRELDAAQMEDNDE